MKLRAPAALALAVLLALTGCADRMPVPGGTETVNESCFKTEDALKNYLSFLEAGLAENFVLSGMCGKKEEIARIERRDIRIALLGGDNLPFPQGDGLIDSLYGYRLVFRNVKRAHGFSSPIRIRTNEAGFSYTVILVFQGGKLFRPPIVSGGPVNNAHSGTIFDSLTPGVIVNRVMK